MEKHYRLKYVENRHCLVSDESLPRTTVYTIEICFKRISDKRSGSLLENKGQ